MRHRKRTPARVCFPLFLLVTGIVAAAGPAAAGCTYSITFKNERAAELTLLKVSSRKTGAGVEGWYKRQWDGETRIAAGATYLLTVKTDLGCNSWKQFKVEYRVGATGYESTRIARDGETSFTWSL